MSEPAPDDGLYEWRCRADHDGDAVGMLTAALLDDGDAAMSILETLTSGQLIALCWTLSRWWGWAFQHGHGGDPLATLRHSALEIARGKEA